MAANLTTTELEQMFMHNISNVLTLLQQIRDKDASQDEMLASNTNLDLMWVLTCGILVVFMQAGFSVLEAGCVSEKNLTNILFKNIMDMSISTICWFLVGYGVAFGDTTNGVIGTSNYAIQDLYNGSGNGGVGDDGWAFWFFQWAFAGTASTIVSGSIAERTKLQAYLIFTVFMTCFIYPVAVHWIWGQGFMSAFEANPDEHGVPRPLLSGTERSNGVLDFAGSGVVHIVGGVSGLVGAVLVGPRKDRFNPVTGQPNEMNHANSTLLCLGAFILWFGWYGFNCGSTLMLSGGAANVAGKVAVTTTISAASGCLVAVVISRVFEHTFDIGIALNGILAALVGVTAGCSVLDPWQAFLVGCVSPMVYYGAHVVLLRFQIDDPLDAFPIHGCCGAWGLLSSGIFCTDDNVFLSGSTNASAPNSACGRGEQFAVQLIAMLAIATWSLALSGFTFWVMRATVGIRVPEDIESEGLDRSEHGATAYAGSFRIGHQHPPRQVAPEPAGKGEPQAEHHQLPPPPANVTTVVPFGHADSNGWGALGMD
mmetsp:Transcript_380/g.958  ORF Transcript_380/g.958 Transcript_380/m.958 type:complete len:539 (+) Transcript_380:150-1766(+)